MPMIPAIKTKWLAALRSGKYLQTRGFLQLQLAPKKKYHYCCLGVLVCVQGKTPKKAGLSIINVVPNDFAAGLTVGEQNKLAEMNDRPDSTFAQIADYIENTL